MGLLDEAAERLERQRRLEQDRQQLDSERAAASREPFAQLVSDFLERARGRGTTFALDNGRFKKKTPAWVLTYNFTDEKPDYVTLTVDGFVLVRDGLRETRVHYTDPSADFRRYKLDDLAVSMTTILQEQGA